MFLSEFCVLRLGLNYILSSRTSVLHSSTVGISSMKSPLFYVLTVCRCSYACEEEDYIELMIEKGKGELEDEFSSGWA